MPRKKGSGKAGAAKSSSSYRPTNFSLKNESLVRVGNAFILSEGKLSNQNIKNLSSNTLFGQLKNDGYITEIKTDKGMYQTTDKFKKDFSKMTGKDIIYGGSGAASNHYRAVSNTATAIPKSVLTSGHYKNGQALIRENSADKKTKSFQNSRNQILRNIQNQREVENRTFRQEMAKASGDKKAQTILRSNHYLKDKELTMREKVIEDTHRGISSPDIQITMNKAEAFEFVQNMRDLAATDEYIEVRDNWNDTLDRMESYIVTTTTEYVEYNIEYCTSSYRREDIIAKENWATVNHTEVFFLKV